MKFLKLLVSYLFPYKTEYRILRKIAAAGEYYVLETRDTLFKLPITDWKQESGHMNTMSAFKALGYLKLLPRAIYQGFGEDIGMIKTKGVE